MPAFIHKAGKKAIKKGKKSGKSRLFCLFFVLF